MGNVIMKAQQITYGASNVEKALDDLKVPELIELNRRMDAIDAWKANVHEVTFTGSELTIENALALPARSLITEINAIQDLHGQSAPYVGGAGKNKFNPNFTGVTGITPSVDSNGYLILTVSGAVSVTFLKGQSITLKANTAYTLSCVGASSNAKVSLRNSDGSTVYASVEVDGGSSVYTPTEDITVYFYIRVETSAALAATLKPQLEEGSSATTFAPYSNICPISGRTAVAVDDTGLNLFDKSDIIENYRLAADGGFFPETGYYISPAIDVVVGETYTKNSPTADAFHRYCTYDADNNVVRASTNNTITIQAPEKTIRFCGLLTEVNTAQFEVGSASTSYQPYAHSSATIQLGTTVYGAEINWDTGMMTVTDAIVDLGTLEWTYNASDNNFYCNSYLDGAPATGYANAICSQYVKHNITGSEMINGDFKVQGARAYVKDIRYADAATFKTAVSGVQLCYELATPTTIQLTPEQLEMLKGYNRVSIEDGSIELKALVLGGDN